jgi:hypothetical protein
MKEKLKALVAFIKTRMFAFIPAMIQYAKDWWWNDLSKRRDQNKDS